MVFNRNNQIPGLIVRADSIKAIDVIFKQQLYPARTINANADLPYWLQDYKTQGPSRHMDIAFRLIMIDNSLFNKIEDGLMSGIYADAIITTTYGGKAAIKDASIIHSFGLELTLLGGIFVLREDLDEMNQQKVESDQTLERFQLIDLEE